jgi:hypothetical protein
MTLSRRQEVMGEMTSLIVDWLWQMRGRPESRMQAAADSVRAHQLAGALLALAETAA